MKEDDSDDWKKLASVGAFDTAYTAKNLKTGKQYKFAVAAENKIGRGELSELESPIILQKKPGNKWCIDYKYIYLSSIIFGQ